MGYFNIVDANGVVIGRMPVGARRPIPAGCRLVPVDVPGAAPPEPVPEAE